MADAYDLIVIGAGSGGLTAAGFAAQLGAKVALVEKHRVGGDCTWTGCVPSKALLKAGKIAHEVRNAAHYGILADPPRVDMVKVRDYVRSIVEEVYSHEAPDKLRHEGIEVFIAPAKFIDDRTISAGEKTLTAKYFLICTGAHPADPGIPGIADVPYITYEQIFDNDVLPDRLLVIGAGPIGMEMAQAYQRLGSKVTMIARRLLPKEEPEVSEVIERVCGREGMTFLKGRATSARMDGSEFVVETDAGEARGDMLLVASGRKPTVKGLDLEKAGVIFNEKGIPVDSTLRTNIKHIFAAGDVVGSHQFTHFAGWQAFQAVRNALLVGSTSGFTDVVPWVTFTDPEVAHVGLTEEEARAKFEKVGTEIKVTRWEMARTDRALCDNDSDGFIKVITKADGTLVGATMVAGRAGEAITEFILALKNGLKVADLANAIHAYPTYSTAVQQLAAGVAVENFLTGTAGKIVRSLSKIIR